jgi:hypothetical protein
MLTRRDVLRGGVALSVGAFAGCSQLQSQSPDVAVYRADGVSEAEADHALTYIQRLGEDANVDLTVERRPRTITPTGTSGPQRAEGFDEALGDSSPGQYSNVLLDTIKPGRSWSRCHDCGEPSCDPAGSTSDVAVVGGFGDGTTAPWKPSILVSHENQRRPTERSQYLRYVALVHELAHSMGCTAHDYGNAWYGPQAPAKYAPDGSETSIYASPLASSRLDELSGITNHYGTVIPRVRPETVDRVYYSTLYSPAVAETFRKRIT